MTDTTMLNELERLKHRSARLMNRLSDIEYRQKAFDRRLRFLEERQRPETYNERRQERLKSLY